MADGRRREAWNRTAHVLAMIHNVHCTKAESMKEPIDLNPLESRQRAVPVQMATPEQFRAFARAVGADVDEDTQDAT